MVEDLLYDIQLSMADDGLEPLDADLGLDMDTGMDAGSDLLSRSPQTWSTSVLTQKKAITRLCVSASKACARVLARATPLTL